MMFEDRIQWIEHKGKRILFTDFSNLESEKMESMLDELGNLMKKEPLGSIRLLSSYENVHFSVNTLNTFNRAAPQQQQYTLAIAIYGIKGLLKVMYDAFAKFSQKEIKVCSSFEDAKDWLAGK